MKFSLVLATVGRVEELKRFLESVGAQRDAAFELIVSDQNLDDRLVPLLESYGTVFPIKHLRSERGLSRARNAGLRHITGDVIAFPDDDCWYHEGLLRSVAHFLQEHPECDGLSVLPVDAHGEPLRRKWDCSSGLITRENAWSRAVSITMFLRRRVIESVGEFDESLGVGSNGPWQSGEETDYILRGIEREFRFYFEPSIHVCHPRRREAFGAAARAEEYKNSCGMGRVLRKHGCQILPTAWKYIVRPAGGVLISALTGQREKSLFYGAVVRGRLRGLMARPGPARTR